MLLGILLYLLFPLKILASINISNWQQNTALPYSIASHVTFTNADKIYVIGGGGTDGVIHSNVLRADIENNGILSAWTTISNLPKPIIWHSLATNGSRVYILGGFTGSSADYNNFDTVYKADITADGSIESWDTLTPLQTESALGSSVIVENRLYYAGGNLNPHQANDPNAASSTIYKADIDPSDGTIGTWSIVGNLPDKMLGFEMMKINNYLYIFGGNTTSGATASVKRALLNSDGTIGDWQDQPSFPQEIWRFGITRVNNTLITAGGGTNTSIINKVYYSNINLDGSITDWHEGSDLPNINCCSPLVSWGNKIYLSGGHDGSSYFDTVYSATVEDLSATPEATPISSPTPYPVSKVFFIPGLGASWNVDALINCKDSDYTGSWTLAPYAKDIYDPVLSTLPTKGWNTIAFYYDWRRDIRDNAQFLNTYITNSNIAQNEKINLVGHSMGGLIGRNYIETQEGGKANKLLMVGTPNQGSALAYPAVVNGEVWANDLIERIAATLQFKHCGVPNSLKNLLPTYNYLRGSKTKQLKDVSTMKTQNNYLPTIFATPFWGVKIGTLAGTGNATLKIIDVIKSSNWPDGKPVGRWNVNEGDGTVLVQSAQIPNANSNQVINQSHSGIIASTEGVNKVLEFLGSPGISDPVYADQTSALIIVGYPGVFWVTDKKGVSTQSDNGMVAIMNPQDGNYRLQMLPTSSTTTFIVSQFLSNGQTLYKEYKFKGFQSISKTIKYSAAHPDEDCVKGDHEGRSKNNWN
jgi:pimeloyl-ACP methyl ester carboxylesterase